MAVRTDPPQVSVPITVAQNHFTGAQVILATLVNGFPSGTLTTDVLEIDSDLAIWDQTANVFVRLDQTNYFNFVKQ
jgi:hypothetical protein